MQNLDKNLFDIVYPGNGRIPQIGDIISFRVTGNPHGHIGIVTHIHKEGFSYLEQN